MLVFRFVFSKSIRPALAIASMAALIGLPTLEAAPVTWTVVGGTFSDGGTMTGSLTYDAATFTCGSYSLSVSGGNTGDFPPLTYAPGPNQSCGADGNVVFLTYADPQLG